MIESLTVFGSFFLTDLVDIITSLGVLAIAFVIFAESGLLIGFFLPGDSLLFTAGVLVQTGLINVNIFVLIALLFVAAVLGDSVGYAFGRRAGPRVFNKPDARLFKQEYIRRAQAFYEKHGGKTIIIARFIPIVRTFAPIVAGTGQMPYRRFLSFNVIGALLWVSLITSAGYMLGELFQRSGLEIDQVILPVIAIIILISVLPPAIHIFRNKRTRVAFWEGTKRELNSIFSKKK
ncbi:MAG: VTT domain-containing protein [Candidatus Saccharimonadales bacterium]